MYKLLLDIGNSSVKVAIAKLSNLVITQRHEVLTDDVLQQLTQCYCPSVAIVSSVRNNTKQIEMMVRQYVKHVIVFTHKTPVPIHNLYTTPETLGIDRMAAAVGATHLFPQRNCLIMDCGTAITIDFLSATAEFIGGNISPGLQMRFKSLHNFTDSLPMGHITDNTEEIGKNTHNAINAGVLHGAVMELEGYIEQYPEHIPVLTGGDAFYFVKKIKKPIFVVWNLNFIGLSKIADYNAYI